MNSKQKGDISVGEAISHFLKREQEVLLPIGDKRPYDLVVEKNGLLQKVQCKFTDSKTSYGIFTVDLRLTGGNQSFHTVKYYGSNDFDVLLVCTSSGDKYEIPASETNKSTINLGKKFAKFRIV